MSTTRPGTWRVLRGALLLAIAFVCGAAVASAAANRASRAYLLGSRLIFTTDQDRLTSLAWRAGDFNAALIHAGCAVEAEFGEAGARAFRPERNPWSLYPFALLDLMTQANKATFDKGQPRMEAMAHAKLAVVWERLGKRADADREYAIAARLTGNKDTDKWHSLGEHLVDSWSQVQDEAAAGDKTTPGSR